MKFCIDCFYYINPTLIDNPKYARCYRTKHLNMIDGSTNFEWCEIERESINPEKCGKDARFFAHPEEHEEWQRDEPQGVTNWDTGWNGVYAEENRDGE